MKEVVRITDKTDPRPARSRARLLEAATALLRTGGPSAVTVDAAGGRVRASLFRQGRELIKVTADVGGDKITTMDFLPIILYKEIPSLDGTRRDVGRLITTTSLFEKLDFQAGPGTFVFDEKSDDPVTRLEPLKVSQVLHGTMDDFYPETSRVLHEY